MNTSERLKWDGAPGELQNLGPRFAIRSRHVLKIIKSERPSKMLEIGAGNGNMALGYYNYVGDLLLSDISSKSVELIQERFKEIKNVRVKRIDVMNEDAEGGFDMILVSEVIEHVEDDKEFLQRVASLLKDDGKILVTVPANEKYRGMEDEEAGHIRRYDYSSLIDLIKKTRLKIVKFIGWGYPIMARYYKFYNDNYDKIARSANLMGNGKSLLRSLAKFAYIVVYYIESLFKRSYDKSLGYIILLEKESGI